MTKVAKDLSMRMEREDPDTEVYVNIMLRPDLSPDQTPDLIQNLSQHSAGPVEYSEMFKIAGLSTNLGNIRAIAKQPGVVHIAESKTEPLEKLMDE